MSPNGADMGILENALHERDPAVYLGKDMDLGDAWSIALLANSIRE